MASAWADSDNSTAQQLLPEQYNSDMLTPTFKIKGVVGKSGNHIDALRLIGPPMEMIKPDARIAGTIHREGEQ